MSIYRIYAGADGESYIEEIHVAQHPELSALRQVAQVGIHEFPALRTIDFHPLPERRLIIHLRGEVEMGSEYEWNRYVLQRISVPLLLKGGEGGARYPRLLWRARSTLMACHARLAIRARRRGGLHGSPGLCAVYLLSGRAHRLQRRTRLRGLLVPMDTTCDLQHTASHCVRRVAARPRASMGRPRGTSSAVRTA